MLSRYHLVLLMVIVDGKLYLYVISKQTEEYFGKNEQATPIAQQSIHFLKIMLYVWRGSIGNLWRGTNLSLLISIVHILVNLQTQFVKSEQLLDMQQPCSMTIVKFKYVLVIILYFNNPS